MAQSKEKINEYARINRARVTAYLRNLRSKPCMDCGGEFPPECMDFDHRPEETKLFHIAQLSHGRSRERLNAEVAKCDIVCANCHRIRTRKRRIGQSNQG
jgi:hypothetical protein